MGETRTRESQRCVIDLGVTGDAGSVLRGHPVSNRVGYASRVSSGDREGRGEHLSTSS